MIDFQKKPYRQSKQTNRLGHLQDKYFAVETSLLFPIFHKHHMLKERSSVVRSTTESTEFSGDKYT